MVLSKFSKWKETHWTKDENVNLFKKERVVMVDYCMLDIRRVKARKQF